MTENIRTEQTAPKSMVPCSPLRRLIESCGDIRDHLRVTDPRWEKLLGRIDRVIASSASGRECYDEEVWTFLTAAAYAASGSVDMSGLIRQLVGESLGEAMPDSVWLECLPLPPRAREGNTNLDLASGSIGERGKTTGGITYAHESSKPGTVVFCEMKWYSDLSKDVTGDPHRNQLIRVIENAVTFQDANGTFPESVYVTLVTPEVFRDRPLMSRLYAYKYAEYSASDGPTAMLRELDACRLSEYAPTTGWKYPEREVLEQRLGALKLNWVTYEELIREAPVNPVADAVREFEAGFNKTKGEKPSTEGMP